MTKVGTITSMFAGVTAVFTALLPAPAVGEVSTGRAKVSSSADFRACARTVARNNRGLERTLPAEEGGAFVRPPHRAPPESRQNFSSSSVPGTFAYGYLLVQSSKVIGIRANGDSFACPGSWSTRYGAEMRAGSVREAAPGGATLKSSLTRYRAGYRPKLSFERSFSTAAFCDRVRPLNQKFIALDSVVSSTYRERGHRVARDSFTTKGVDGICYYNQAAYD